MTTIRTFHSSGEWNNSAEALARNVKRTRADGRTLGTRTELTTASHSAEVSVPEDGWGVWHPRNPETGSRTDCAVEWDQAVWRRVQVWTAVLNANRLHTEKGFLLPPSRMPLVLLEHRETGRRVLLGAFHMQLANTARRRAAWRAEAAAIRSISREMRRQHPGWQQVFQGDGNRNQRITALREAVQDHMLTGTALHNCWSGHIPATGGTHGPRSILDLTVSTMPGGSRLLPDDASSDHRPYETRLTL